MTRDQIQLIILTKKYPFTMGDLFDHYSLAGGILIVPITSFYCFFQDSKIDNFLLVLSSICLIMSLSVFFYFGPKQRRFELINIHNISDEELYESCRKIFSQLKWQIVESNQINYLKAFRPWSLSDGINRGQEITIIIEKSTIYAISLYSTRTGATFWNNRNHTNIVIFKRGLSRLGLSWVSGQ